jgi:hypothetical protein
VVILPNGKEVTDHKLLPSKELEDAMDAFVTSMELPKESDGRYGRQILNGYCRITLIKNPLPALASLLKKYSTLQFGA